MIIPGYTHVSTHCIREERVPSDAHKLYETFRQWLERNPSLDFDAIAEEDRSVNYSNEGQFQQYYEGGVDEHYIENPLPHNPYDPLIGGSEPLDGEVPSDLSPAFSPTDEDIESSYVSHGETVASLLSSHVHLLPS